MEQMSLNFIIERAGLERAGIGKGEVRQLDELKIKDSDVNMDLSVEIRDLLR